MFDEYTEGFNAGFDFAHTGPALKKLEAEAEERGFRRAVTDRDYLRIHRQRMEIMLDQVEDAAFDKVLNAFSEFGLFNTSATAPGHDVLNRGGAIHEWLRVNRDRILSNGLPIRGDLVKTGGAE
jgi:hypothetical protein